MPYCDLPIYPPGCVDPLDRLRVVVRAIELHRLSHNEQMPELAACGDGSCQRWLRQNWEPVHKRLQFELCELRETVKEQSEYADTGEGEEQRESGAYLSLIDEATADNARDALLLDSLTAVDGIGSQTDLVDPLENLTTYQVDPSPPPAAVISWTPTTISYNGNSNLNQVLFHRPIAIAADQNFEWLWRYAQGSSTSTETYVQMACASVTSEHPNNVANGGVWLEMLQQQGNYRVYLVRRALGAGSNSSTSHTATTGVHRYARLALDRSVGTFGQANYYMYSDSSRTNLVQSLSLNMADKIAYGSMQACRVFNNRVGATTIFNLGDYDLQMPVPPATPRIPAPLLRMRNH